MNLTQNQQDLKICLTDESTQLKVICDKYAVIQAKKGYNPSGYVWSATVSRIIQALIVHGVAEKTSRGFYKLK